MNNVYTRTIDILYDQVSIKKNMIMEQTRSQPIGWARQNPAPVKFDPDAIFSNFDKWQPEAACDVISSVAVDYVAMDICVKFGVILSLKVAE